MGVPQGGRDRQSVMIHRGPHCPLCQNHPVQFEDLQGKFHEIGVDAVVASGDPQQKTQVMTDEKGLTPLMGDGLSVENMRTLGLYVSDPRSPQETDRPFPEPGLFVINGDGRTQMLDISNAPFLCPDLKAVLGGITFIRNNDYPVRGLHKAAQNRDGPDQQMLARARLLRYAGIHTPVNTGI